MKCSCSPKVSEVDVVLLIVDPQNDFMGNDDGTPYQEGGNTASLPVKGAVADIKRTTCLIDDDVPDKIVVTRDRHPKNHIGHAAYWFNKEGRQPTPFTTSVSAEDVLAGTWTPYTLIPSRLAKIIENLKRTGPQTIWPKHCVADTWGYNVQIDLAAALARWEEKTGKKVIYLDKGMDPDLEEYGADVADEVREARIIIYVAGEASSHCVKATLEQAVAKLNRKDIRKFELLVDCMSPVPGFEKVAAQFFDDMEKEGMMFGLAWAPSNKDIDQIV